MEAKKHFNYLQQAKELIQKRNLPEAEKVLKKGIRANSNFYLYYCTLGDVYLKLNKPFDAEKHYHKAFFINPKASWISKKINILSKLNALEFAGAYNTYPDLTGKRQLEGGKRLNNGIKTSKPQKPLVSIITVVYNNQHSLQQCIDSVKNQLYSNIEHIVIDGGSNDKTIDIIESNESLIDYFVSEPDDGIYAAMNKGIRVASGEYICLLNSDDTYDPKFVELTVKKALEQPTADIIYSDYYAGDNHLVAQPVSQGILFGHLHVCHNTFLASRKAYNTVGPYDETYKIVSDAIWMRKAFLQGMRFECINTPLFTLHEGGLSSGSTEDHRRLFIREAAKSYQENFPELTIQDAESIYLFRFNKSRTKELATIAEKYKKNTTLINALRLYVEHCFKDRKNFRLAREEADTVFPLYLKLVDQVGVDIRTIRLATKNGDLGAILKSYESILLKGKKNKKTKILHFISVFSAPSETFVYNLVSGLDNSTSDNFVLYEHEKLSDERPYDKKLGVFWNDYSEIVAKRIYKHIVESLNPDVVIAHFALNDWNWAKRIEGLNINIPTISMCHGIDAFSMRDNNDYKDYLINNFSKRKNTQFTAVSHYLKEELLRSGIPEDKITLVPNSVRDTFFRKRKSTNFFKGDRPLEIVSVGRLIPLKGHKFLLEAASLFSRRSRIGFNITIVYGNSSDCLESLQEQARNLGIETRITFIPYVDFDQEPEFLSRFDLFVHPSIYSDDAYNRSETFGIAVLEAITAGLPVICSNAGGLPEVIGSENTFARIVPHSDANSIANAMLEMIESRQAFSDNKLFAEKKLREFSQEKQIQKLEEVIHEVTNKKIKAALFSTSTIQGAGYAAYRLHRGLRETRIESHLFTTVRNHEDQPDVTVLKHPSGDNRQWNVLQLNPKDGLTISTVNHPHISSKDLIEMVEPYDIINLHWHARFLSIENIATLTHLDKPVVMTVRDMMPITGGCHYFHDCKKWKSDCSNCPQINSVYTDFPAKVLEAKRSHYNFDNLTLVALSNHTKNILQQSPYFSNCRIEVINNSIETDVFKPHDKMACRKEFGLPQDRKIIGYVPSFSSEVKGYKEFLKAMDIVKAKMGNKDPFVMLVGNETPATNDIKQDKKALGYISNNLTLARAYSAADVVVVPSLEETFSNTTAESTSCGVPVVGFRTGAIPDLAVDGISGCTYEVGDFAGLANGIVKLLVEPIKTYECREFAERKLAFSLQAEKYEALFLELLNENKVKRRVPSSAPIYENFGDPGALLNKIGVVKILDQMR